MSSLKVAVRVRPFNQREIDMEASTIVQMDCKKTRLFKPKLSSIREANRDNFHDFTFDYSYWSFKKDDKHFATQEQVYKDLGTDVIDCAFEGYNACVFAYGQTGSGKTYTMMGSPNEPGLIPRICQELFARMKKGQESGTGYKTHASYLEIYNERVKDLLGPHNTEHGLRVREHRVLGPYVENLSQHPVASYEEIQECITRGNIQRTTASTNMNDTSSRSHAIFTITFVQAGFMNDMPSETVSKIHLVDLAGSERANATGATGQRLKEGAHINKSLVTLGSVISALAEQTNRTDQKRILYIPYRDSVLTWLLKDSLGGNSKTIMIAALSPADCNYSETLSTLRYANRAKNIINKPTINEDPNVKLIRELRDEINKLKSMLTSGMQLKEPSSKVLEDLLKKEAQEKVLTEEWTEKWKEAQSILQEQKSLGLRKAGVGVVLDSEMPHLIGIHNDITTGVTLYSLKEGETLIGTEESDEPQDIVLSGVGIQPQHCSIILKDGLATLYPKPQAQCWLNAHLINEPMGISQGDIILLGRTNIFRFNNPAEAARLRKDLSRSRLDLSRLSLSRLSLITASRENLNSNYCADEDGLNNSSSQFKKQYYPSTQTCREDPEIQDENRKILETIENALKQLNTERVQMHEQYKSKVKKLSEELRRLQKEERGALETLKCKEQELLAKKDMLLWEKNNEKLQIDIVCRQISALQTQLDSKKRDFYEYVAKELQELQDCGKLDEIGIKITEDTPLSHELLTEISEFLDPYASQVIRETVKRNTEEIKRLEEQISEKEIVLNASNDRISKLDGEVMKLEQELDELKKTALAQSNADEIKQKKLSMKLQLKNIPIGNNETIIESDESGDKTCTEETFHTANSDCSFQSTSNSSQNLQKYCDDYNENNLSTVSTTTTTDNPLMSDSGVCLDTMRSSILNGVEGTSGYKFSPTNGILNNGRTNSMGNSMNNFNKAIAINGDDDTNSCSSSEHHLHNNQHSDKKMLPPSFCVMHKLRRKIAAQKALIMKNLEMEVNKTQLDEQIMQLQELQRKYVQLEKELQINGSELDCCTTAMGGSRSALLLSLDQDISKDNLENTSVHSDESKETTTYNSRSFMSPLSESLYAPSTTRSCPSIESSSSREPDQFLTIPSFVIRGAGKQTHYEYEVKIILSDGRLNLLRRYSRFRELHLSMKHCYGSKIASLPFPRREIFSSNSESLAKQRRFMLEIYLRRLLNVCSKIPQCPIYDGPGGPGITKISLAIFSPFFKKGLFESGKHGTG